MALEESMKENESEEKTGNLSEQAERDLDIAVLLGERLVDAAADDVIKPALQSRDPGQVLGQFFLTLIKKIDESFVNDMALDKSIYLAEGGWLEQMSDYLQDEYNVSEDITNRMESYVASMATQMAQQGQQAPADPNAQVQDPAQPAPPQQPVMPGAPQA